MNEELQLELSQLIKKGSQGVEKGIELFNEELPDVVYQLILWHGVESAIWAFISIMLGCFMVFLNIKIIKSCKGKVSEV